MSLYFRPEKAVLGDVIPYYDNGVFKPFYLRNYRANRDEQHQDSWVMLSTTDHIHYTEHDTKIVGGTGSVIKVDGLYHVLLYLSEAAGEDGAVPRERELRGHPQVRFPVFQPQFCLLHRPQPRLCARP